MSEVELPPHSRCYERIRELGAEVERERGLREVAERERDSLRDCGVDFGACMPPCAKHAEEVWHRWHGLIEVLGRIVQKDNALIDAERGRAEALEAVLRDTVGVLDKAGRCNFGAGDEECQTLIGDAIESAGRALAGEPAQPCATCGGEGYILTEDEYETVTREMAIDGGETALENHRYRTKKGDYEPCPEGCQPAPLRHLIECTECDGSGLLDSGGFTPQGEPINIPCLGPRELVGEPASQDSYERMRLAGIHAEDCDYWQDLACNCAAVKPAAQGRECWACDEYETFSTVAYGCPSHDVNAALAAQGREGWLVAHLTTCIECQERGICERVFEVIEGRSGGALEAQH